MPQKPSSMDFGPSTQQFDTVISHDALAPGARLGGYQIIDVLGRGGFGIVYLALDSSLQRQVAIKEYLPAELAMRCEDGQVWVKPGADATAYASGMAAFLNEAKMLARFDHPSLARVHSFWEENRTAYMVMPYYEGHTLAAVLADLAQPPDEAWLRALLNPLLSALSTLHNAQCLHLDISPGNIIVLSDGRPVLLDFGVASRIATDKTMPLTALLNPAYAPIEQYSESPALPQGPWSDLYALASVLHFAIAGQPPARATVRAIEDPQRPLAETVAARAEQFPGLQYSASFLAAIDKALAVKPRERPRSAAEFQFMLDHVTNGATASHAPGGAPTASPFQTEPNAAQPSAGQAARPGPAATADPWLSVEPTDAPRKPAVRSRAPLYIAAVATLGLAAVAGWAWMQRQPSQAQITVSDLPPAVVARVPMPASVANGARVIAQVEPPEQAASAAAPSASLAAASAVSTQAGPMAESAASGVAPTAGVTATPPPLPAAPVQTAAASTPSTNAAPAESAEPAATKPVTRNEKKAAPPPAPVATTPAEPNNPRAMCGTRTNFALLYCMEQQCKRAKYSGHPQCLDLRQRGEL